MACTSTGLWDGGWVPGSEKWLGRHNVITIAIDAITLEKSE